MKVRLADRKHPRPEIDGSTPYDRRDAAPGQKPTASGNKSAEKWCAHQSRFNDGIADTDVGRRIARKKDRLPNQRRNLERLKADNSSAQRSSQGSETARTQSHQPAPHEVGWRIIPPTGNTPGPRTKDPHHITGGTAAQRRPPTESREDDESWLV